MKTIKSINLRTGVMSLIFLVFYITLLSSCGTTSGVSMEVLVPAQINLPKHIKKVGVLNRSMPAKGDWVTNVLEGFISGESIMADKDASINCVQGLVDILNENPRLGAVLVTAQKLKGTGTREWPDALAWTTVDSLCKAYNVDAIVSLETFDSDILFSTGKNLVKTTIDKKDTMVNEFFSDLKVNVNAGWRIYDNVDKKQVDQNLFVDEKGWLTKGWTADEALKKLPAKRDAINGAGLFAGDQYGIRISPAWTNVYRSYFTKGKKQDGFKQAKKWVKQQNWEQAVNIWTNIAKTSDSKNVGRAYYNLAVASEVDGDLETAYTYVKKALEVYGNKNARTYMNILNVRIQDQDKLKEQMGN
ncbi:MAG: DUF6340 family protein [Bacteroidota bacterium]